MDTQCPLFTRGKYKPLSVFAAIRDEFVFVPKEKGTHARVEGPGDWS